MKLVNLSIAAAAVCMFATSGYAVLTTEDRVLRDNYVVDYTKAPGAVDSFSEILSKGELYGRLRSHAFLWEQDTESTANQDNDMWGLGGSLVGKTAFYHGFGATAGFFGTTQVLNSNANLNRVGTFGKTGKDTYRTRRDGSEANIGVFAEAFLEYKAGKTDVKVGRQGIESVMLATNDTKMVPNTFEAAMVENKDIKDTSLRVGYITAQKLRDHQVFHSLIAVDSVSRVENNDDSGRHNGLNTNNISRRGDGNVNPGMIFLAAESTAVPNLRLNGEYIALDGFVNTAIAEANYKIKLNDAWTLTPGVRYLHQMDDGAGKIGGAAVSGLFGQGTAPVRSGALGGYKDANSVDGSIIMARLVAASGPLELAASYSQIGDGADIIAPWRGFPTGGYTRVMGQVDWIANSRNSTVRAAYDFDKAGIVPGFKMTSAYAIMNVDNSKAFASGHTDRKVIHVDAWKTFKAVPNTEFKARFLRVDADNSYTSTTAQAPTDTISYNEYRFEINYLF